MESSSAVHIDLSVLFDVCRNAVSLLYERAGVHGNESDLAHLGQH